MKEKWSNEAKYELMALFYPGNHYDRKTFSSNIISFRYQEDNNDLIEKYLKDLDAPCFLFDPDNLVYLLDVPNYNLREHTQYLIEKFPDSELTTWARLFLWREKLLKNEDVPNEMKLNPKDYDNPFTKKRIEYYLTNPRY